MRTAAIALSIVMLSAGGVPARPAPPSVAVCPKVDLRPRPAPATCGRACGVDRWGIKTLSDRDRRRVVGPPVATTVAELAAIAKPARRPPRTRVRPVETTIYCLEAWVIAWDDQDDEDIHITLIDPVDGRTTMIAEIPNPQCAGACGSGYAHLFAAAREAFEEGLASATTDTVRIRIMGVGFFDKAHGQSWAPPNLIEIHPVLAIEFP